MNQRPHEQKPVVAAFDFDGTMTTRDALLSFLFYAMGRGAAIKKLCKLALPLIATLIDHPSRQNLKETILTHFFAGMPIEQLRDLGKAFASSNVLKNLVRPEAKRALDWHRRQGHRCVLITATVDLYAAPWSRLVGFHDIICSQLETTSDGIVTGHLKGPNCWGQEKVFRLERLFGPKDRYTLYAYGDSRGDRELLAAADYPFFRDFSSYEEKQDESENAAEKCPDGSCK